MTYSFYQATILPIRASLLSLRTILKEGEDYAASKSIPVDDIITWRLADDMLPLSFQVHVVADIAMKFIARVNKLPIEEWPFDYKTLAEVYARIEAAEAWLEKADEATFDEKTEQIVQLRLGAQGTTDVPAKGWWACYGAPNLYFHLTIAYAILRNRGVPLGKNIYLTPFGTDWITSS